MASIYSIVYQPMEQKYAEHLGEYARLPLPNANLIAGYGMQGDQKAGHHPDRQLNLLSREWLLELQAKGYKTAPGQFGEQIILTGLAVERLEPGARLQLGRQVCIEITKPRTGCDRLESAQGKSIKDLGPVGVLAKVTQGGAIEVGDPVIELEPALHEEEMS